MAALNLKFFESENSIIDPRTEVRGCGMAALHSKFFNDENLIINPRTKVRGCGMARLDSRLKTNYSVLNTNVS
jgi:hypothetical protein